MNRAESGDDNDDGGRVQLARLFENFNAMGAGLVEIEIGNDEVGGVFVEGGEGGRPVGEREYLVPLLAKQFGDHLNHGQIVINEDYFCHWRES